MESFGAKGEDRVDLIGCGWCFERCFGSRSTRHNGLLTLLIRIYYVTFAV